MDKRYIPTGVKNYGCAALGCGFWQVPSLHIIISKSRLQICNRWERLLTCIMSSLTYRFNLFIHEVRIVLQSTVGV